MRRHDPPKIRKTLPPTRLTESGDQPTLKQPNQRISVPPLAPPPQMLADGDPTQTDLGRLREHVERIDAAAQGKIPVVRFPPPPAVPVHRIGGVLGGALPKPNAPPRSSTPKGGRPAPRDDFDQDVTADARVDTFSTESYRAQTLGTVGELDTAEVSTLEEAVPTHASTALAFASTGDVAAADDSEEWNETVTAPKGVPAAPKSAPHAPSEPQVASAKSSSGVRLAHETSSNYQVLASDEVEYSDFADDDDEDDETRAMHRDELVASKGPDLRDRLSASGDHFVSSSEITAASLDVQTLARRVEGVDLGQPHQNPTMPDGDPETLQAMAPEPRKHPATLVSREAKPASERPPPRRAAVAAALADSGAIPLSPSTSPMPVVAGPIRTLAQEPALLDLSDAHPVPGETTSVAPLQAPVPQRYAPANVHPAPMYATLASPQPLYAPAPTYPPTAAAYPPPAPTYPPPARPRTEQMQQGAYPGYATPASQPPLGHAPSFSTPAPHVVPAAPAFGNARQATFPPGQFPAVAVPARPRYLLWVAYGLLVGGFGVIFGARYFGATDGPAAATVASAPVASTVTPAITAPPQPPPPVVAPPATVASVAPPAAPSVAPSASAAPTAEAQNLPKPHAGGGYRPPAPRPRAQPAAARPPKPEGPSLPQSMDPPQPPQPATPSPSDILTDAL